MSNLQRAVGVPEQRAYVSERLIVGERPEGKITFVGVVQTYVSSSPASQSHGHAKRSCSGDARNGGPLCSEEQVSRTIQSLRRIARASRQISGMLGNDEIKLLFQGLLIARVQGPGFRSSIG